MGEDEKPLPWTDEEIVMHYRAAKNKAEIIPILADLNAATTTRIKRVLKRRGVKIESEHVDERRKPIKDEKPVDAKKTTRTCKPKVFIVLENGGAEFSVNDIARRIGKSVTYVKARIRDVDAVRLGGIEYKIKRYKKWGRKNGHQNEM